jgi:3-hydroxyisobutyrate dehydrogenase-like beta-hydroxyacid dehydrogenase
MGVPEKIGFIGLGIMGRAMALNLVKDGRQVSVYNRTRSHTTPFADLGCAVASTPRELGFKCDIIITMVADMAAMDAVLEGPEGVFSSLKAGNTLINMSTLAPEYTAALAKKCFTAGIEFLDCPVSGSKPLAESGQLVILAAGKKESVQKHDALLKVMGYAGHAPAGTALKLCVNLVVGQLSTAITEAAALAEAQKIDPALVFATLELNPALNCKYFQMKKDNVLKKDYPPAFPLKHMLKDSRLMLAAAAAAGLRLPVTEAMERLLAKSYNSGYGEKDLTAVLKALTD